LDFIQSGTLETNSARRIAESFKRLDSIKKLSLKFNENFAEFNQVLLKEGLTFMKSLEVLKLKCNYSESSKPEINNFKQFQDISRSLNCLKGFDLDLSESYPLHSEEVKSIVSGFSELKSIEKFRFEGVTSSPLPDLTFNQLSSFLISIRHIKDLHFSLGRISYQNKAKLWQNLLPNFSLSNNPF